MDVSSATLIDTPLATTMETSPATDPSVASTMDDPPASLPSTVEETLSHCPSLLLQTGVGKSSLIASIFNVSQEVSSSHESFSNLTMTKRKQDIDIADGRAGAADINREYTSDDNPRFALHDSKGFEPGSTNNWGVVEEFIHQRSKKSLHIEQRLHALWLCIETPRPGSRLMQTADEDLLKLAITRKIPVIVVFTKFDLLYNVFFAKAVQQGHHSIDPNQVSEAARTSLETSIEVFQQQFDLSGSKFKRVLLSRSKHPLSYVGVSTNRQFTGFLHTLEELTEVTRKCLHTRETFVPWAVAQRIDPKQKVQTSIEDPEMLLTGKEFHVQMLKLVEPFVPQSQSRSSVIRHLPVLAALAAIFGPLFPPLAIALGVVGFTAVAIEFLYNNYRAAPGTALFLEAYIIDLTLFLHELFVTALQTEWQKPLDSELVSATFERYKRTKSERIHKLIRNSAPSAHEALSAKKNKKNIGDLIREQLTLDEGTDSESHQYDVDAASGNTYTNLSPGSSDDINSSDDLHKSSLDASEYTHEDSTSR
ncbi:hypothetical protein C0995_005916 [Termitomyces sp. Mi166|nr:hypothetical protein C0995_005916 [Termitomyces sp. Mi166\